MSTETPDAPASNGGASFESPGAAAPPRPKSIKDRVNVVSVEAPWLWLAAGWRDLCAVWPMSLGLGLLFTLGGVGVTVGLVLVGLDYLVTSAIAGFLMIAPAFAMVFYAISRDLEEGRRPRLIDILTAWRANPFHMLALGVALMFLMMLWLRFAALIFAIFFPYVSMSWGSMLDQTLSAEGIVFLAVGSAVGAAFAALSFMVTVVSMPMMLDRRVDAVEAVLTSIVAVVRNPKAMALWAALIVVFTQSGLVTALIGLSVTLPLIGHASWHAYRAVVAPPEPGYTDGS